MLSSTIESVSRRRKRAAEIDISSKKSTATAKAAATTTHVSKSVFRLAIDYGTTKIAAAWQICEVSGTSLVGPHDVEFENNSNKTPNIASYDGGHFSWGKVVADRLEAGDLSESQIIRFAKLAIFKDPQTANFYDTVNNKLAAVNKTTEDLIGDCVRVMIEHAKKHAKKTVEGAFQGIFEDMPMILFLSVPQMWSQSACTVMTTAARKAGAPNCNLVFEPECAAVYTVIKQVQSPHATTEHMLKTGDRILVADIGGGTADFVTYEVMSDVSDKARINFKTVEVPEGELCGGQWVNEEFLGWLKDTYFRSDQEQLKKVATALGYNEEDFLAHASVAFEDHKLKFSLDKPVYNIQVNGRHDSPLDSKNIRLSLNDIKSFFDRIMDEIFSTIDSYLGKCGNVKVIVVPGGFGHSSYLFDKLCQKYGSEIHILKPANSHANPVPHGALLRHHVTVQSTVSQFSWGTFISEEPSVEWHPDAVLQKNLKEAVNSGTIAFDPELLINDVDCPNDMLIRDRWHSLITKGERLEDGGKTRRAHRILYPESPANGGPVETTIDIYCSRNVVNQHDPGRQKLPKERLEVAEPNNYLSDGIEHWQTVSIKEYFPRALGWTASKFANGERLFKVHVAYELVADGPNVEFRAYPLRKYVEVHDENGEERELDPIEDFEPEPRWKHKVWDVDFSSIPRTIR